MKPAELEGIFQRLQRGPVPTSHKKLYACAGPLERIIAMAPGALLVRCNALDAVPADALPAQEEAITRLLIESLSAQVSERRAGRRTSIAVVEESAVLAHYKVALTPLFSLVGDAHAVVLHVRRPPSGRAIEIPSYVRLVPTETWNWFTRCLPDTSVLIAPAEV
jgi:hypothetical protein